MKDVIRRSIKFFIFAISISIIAMIIAYIVNPDLEGVVEGLDDKVPDHVDEASGLSKVWAYIVNNGFAVPLQMFILSLIPVQFLYLLNLIFTNATLGAIFGALLRYDAGSSLGIIVSSVPHGLLEALGYSVLAAVLFKLNQVVRIKIKNIFKKDEGEASFSHTFLETISIYVMLALPIIIVAAFVETYVTDFILSFFQ